MIEPPSSPNPAFQSVPEEPRSVEQLTLRRPPFWTPGALMLAAMGSLLLVHMLMAVGMALVTGGELRSALAEGLPLLLFSVVGGGFFGYRTYARSRPLAPIRFFDSYIDLPSSVHGTGRQQVPYQDILFIRMGGHPPHLRVLVESREHLFFYDQASFVDPSGPELVFLELRRRIMSLPQGRDILQAMRRREHITGKALAVRPWATQILLGVLGVFYLNQVFTSEAGTGSFSLFDWVSWGAVVPQLVREGELYRLLSANFLHMGTAHIVLNGLALFSLGGVMERFLGWERFLVVYLLSGLAATVGSTLAHPFAVSAGASGCVFGVFGALAVVNIKYWKELPMGFFRQPKRWWVFIIGINAAIPILVPIINVTGHLAGMTVGAIATYILLRGHDSTPAAPVGPAVRMLALGLASMYAVSLGTAVVLRGQYNAETRGEHAMLLAKRMLEQDGDAHSLNELAFAIAMSPTASDSELAQAEQLAKRAVEKRPALFPLIRWWLELANKAELVDRASKLSTQDTLATVYYRQGRFDEAARLELDVVTGLAPIASKLDPDEPLLQVQWPQLERFLAARHEAEGPLSDFALDDAPDDAAASTVDWSVRTKQISLGVERPRGKGPRLALHIAPPQQKAATVYALVWKGQRRLGLLRIDVGNNPPSQLTYRPDSTFPLTDDLRLELGAVRLGTLEDVPVGAAHWHWFPTDPTVAQWP